MMIDPSIPHHGERLLHREGCFAGIQGKDAVKLLFCDLPQRRATAMTGAGKHNIDIALLPPDRLVESIEISQLRRIALHSGHIASNRFDRFVPSVLEAYLRGEVRSWMKSLKLSGKSKGHIHSLMRSLFQSAMLWEWIPVAVNPMSLFRTEGSSKTQKRRSF
jgi:hypothetical protein